MTLTERLSHLRMAMKENGLDAYIIPSADPHQSEYVSTYWKSRQWISGFSGSAGTAVITKNHAGIWTDSRYFIQAEAELAESPFVLHKLNIPHTPEHLDWMLQNLSENSTVGLDGRLFSVGNIRKMASMFYKKNIEIRSDQDLILGIWEDRPPLPENLLFEHSEDYTGKTRSEKLKVVQDKMQEAEYYLITTLDDIAWLFNLRGSDVACNPVFYSFALVGKELSYLFVEPQKVSQSLKQKLNNDGVLVKPYHEIEKTLSTIPEGKKVLIDTGSTNNQLYNSVPTMALVEGVNIVASLKAIKNDVEINHIKAAMRKDGVALTRFFIWLEKTLKTQTVTEAEAAQQIAAFRKEQTDYFGESFNAIVGYEGNGAIVHYTPEPGICAAIQPKGILLVDSGGQFADGTTDITRTIALSPPTPEQKKDFTLVLKGVISLTNAVFPKGTTGVQLDALARMHLWRSFSDYGHGTGHGVGFFNNVHEGPQGFSPAVNTPRANTVIEPGMLTSNEPGLYKTNKYGIRTENLILCVKAGESDFGEFYKFETLTLFPIDTTLIEKSLLTEEESTWINHYHNKVFEVISPYLNDEEKAWLRIKCNGI